MVLPSLRMLHLVRVLSQLTEAHSDQIPDLYPITMTTI